MSEMDDLTPRPAPRPCKVPEIVAKPEVPEVSLIFDKLQIQHVQKISSPNYWNTNCAISRSIDHDILATKNLNVSPNEHAVAKNSHFPQTSESSIASSCNNPNISDSILSTSVQKLEHVYDFSDKKKVTFSDGIKSMQDVCNVNKCCTDQKNRCINFAEDYVSHYYPVVSGPENGKQWYNSKVADVHCGCSRHRLEYSNENLVENALRNYSTRLNVIENEMRGMVKRDEFVEFAENIKKHLYNENMTIYVTKNELRSILGVYEQKIQTLENHIHTLINMYGATSKKTVCLTADSRVHNCGPRQNFGMFENKGPVFDNRNIAVHDSCDRNQTDGCGQKKGYCSQNDFLLDKIPGNNEHNCKCGLAHRNSYTPHGMSTCGHTEQKLCKNFGALSCEISNDPYEKISPYNCDTECCPRTFDNSPSQKNGRTQHRALNLTNDVPKNTETKGQIAWKQEQKKDIFYDNIITEVKNIIGNQLNVENVNRIDTSAIVETVTMKYLENMPLTGNGTRSERQAEMSKEKLGAERPHFDVDVSLCMNSLATKYVPRDQTTEIIHNSDEERIVNDVSNISISTLRYLERYQLLPHLKRQPPDDVGEQVTDGQNENNQNQAPVSRVLDITTLKQQPKLL